MFSKKYFRYVWFRFAIICFERASFDIFDIEPKQKISKCYISVFIFFIRNYRKKLVSKSPLVDVLGDSSLDAFQHLDVFALRERGHDHDHDQLDTLTVLVLHRVGVIGHFQAARCRRRVEPRTFLVEWEKPV